LNILFLGYWNLADPLTEATILPNLGVLRSFDNIKNLYFSNVQREAIVETSLNKLEALNVNYKPLFSRYIRFNLINKLYDFLILPLQIMRLCKENNIDLIIARGAPAGGLVYLSKLLTKIPFVVESYEPHANYMLDAKVWSKWSFKFVLHSWLEKKVNRHASFLITVSNQYKTSLVQKGVSDNAIFVNPCTVDFNLFSKQRGLGSIEKSEFSRYKKRGYYFGIYAGKFGGLYYDEKTFELISLLFEFLEGKLVFIILSNIDDIFFEQMLGKYNISSSKIIRRYVRHDEVSFYLNACDFAIAPYKSTKSSRYLSPVKLAEYWACELPIMLSDKVGDDHLIIEEKKLGVNIDFNNLSSANYVEEKFRLLFKLIENDRSHIKKYVENHRNISTVKETYREILAKYS
jgi:glycosyltransferase involved in cell wall biosynthesis